MSAWNKTTLKKYIAALKKEKKKIVTCEMLSYTIGVYPEVIAEALSKYDPLIPMDYEYNLMSILPVLEKDLSEMESQSSKKEKKIRITKKEIEMYDLASFVYAKMTTGGLVNRDMVLSDKDLKMMKRLIIKEEQERKKNQKAKK